MADLCNLSPWLQVTLKRTLDVAATDEGMIREWYIGLHSVWEQHRNAGSSQVILHMCIHAHCIYM